MVTVVQLLQQKTVWLGNKTHEHNREAKTCLLHFSTKKENRG